MTVDLQEVLRLVNRAREAQNKTALGKLPPGAPGSSIACPLARALDSGKVSVDECVAWGFERPDAVARAWWGEHEEASCGEVELPHVLSAFVADFDAGEIPELVAES